MLCVLQGHVADQSQDVQKQRLLQPDSPSITDSPRSASASQRQQHLQPLPGYSPRQPQPHQQLPQQLQQHSPQQASDSSDDWNWPSQSSPGPSQQAFEVQSQAPAVTQNGTAHVLQQSQQPRSAGSAARSSPDPQDQDGSQRSSPSSRPRTATQSPRVTNETLVSIRAKNVSWQVLSHPTC